MTRFYWGANEILSTSKKKALAVKVAQAFCIKEQISYREIIARHKTYATVYKRVRVARYLDKHGFKQEYIAYALNRDRTCIKNYLDEERFKITEPALGHA